MGEREKEIEELLEKVEKKNPTLKMFGILARVQIEIINDLDQLEKRIEYLEQANETRYSDLADDKE